MKNFVKYIRGLFYWLYIFLKKLIKYTKYNDMQ